MGFGNIRYTCIIHGGIEAVQMILKAPMVLLPEPRHSCS